MRRALTLIELVVVVGIVLILVALVVTALVYFAPVPSLDDFH